MLSNGQINVYDLLEIHFKDFWLDLLKSLFFLLLPLLDKTSRTFNCLMFEKMFVCLWWCVVAGLKWSSSKIQDSVYGWCCTSWASRVRLYLKYLHQVCTRGFQSDKNNQLLATHCCTFGYQMFALNQPRLFFILTLRG